MLVAESAVPAQSIAFSPDARFLYATDYASPLYRYDIESGEQVVIPTPTGRATDIEVAPAGDRIAFVAVGASSDDRQVYTANADGSDIRRVPAGAGAYDIAFSRDGSRLAIIRDDNRIAVVPLDAGQPTVFEAGPVAGGLDW
jgi:Tol biopolymer transport system component